LRFRSSAASLIKGDETKRGRTDRPNPPMAHTRPSSWNATAPFPGCLVRYTVPADLVFRIGSATVWDTLSFICPRSTEQGVFVGGGAGKARTFRSYRPTRWSADTDRAIERSGDTAVAMTAAAIAQMCKVKSGRGQVMCPGKVTGFDVEFG